MKKRERCYFSFATKSISLSHQTKIYNYESYTMKIIFFSNKTVIYQKRVRNATIFRSFHRELEEAGTGAKSSSVAPSFSFNFKLG